MVEQLEEMLSLLLPMCVLLRYTAGRRLHGWDCVIHLCVRQQLLALLCTLSTSSEAVEPPASA